MRLAFSLALFSLVFGDVKLIYLFFFTLEIIVHAVFYLRLYSPD